MIPRWMCPEPQGMGEEATNKSISPALLGAHGDSPGDASRRAYVADAN